MEVKDEVKQMNETTSKTHRLEENKYNTLKIWKQNENNSSDGIIPKINHNKRVVKEALNNIMGEDNEDYNKVKIDNTKNKKELKISRSSKNFDLVSPYAKKILKKINRQIKKIKQSSEDITAMNALYLDNNIFPKTFKNNERYNNSLNLSERIKYNDKSNNNIISINNSKDDNLIKDNYREGIIKKEKRNNFLFVNSNYRSQLNSAFLKYNPITYLNNLKILLQVSPSIREDIIKTKKEVEEDIKVICDKHRYTKKLNSYLAKKNIRSRSVEMDNQNLNEYKMNDMPKNKKKLIINTNINPNLNNSIKDDDSNSPKNNKPTFSFLPKIAKEKVVGSPNQLNVRIFAKLKRKETQKILTIKDQKVEEAKKIFKITKEIENFLSKKNIGEKVDKYIDDYNLQRYFCQLDENQYKNIIKDKDYYRQEKEKINEMLGEIYINKIERKAKDKEKYYNNRIRRDKNDYFFKLEGELKKSLKDFDNNIILNEINLKPDQPNESLE